MVRLFLVRHAQSEWNALGRWQGWADPPLSPLGREQAGAAGRALRDAGAAVDVVISSDLVRAADSAGIVADASCPGADRTLDAGWREYRVGAWSGLTRQEIEEQWPGVLARYDQGDLDATPGGEPRRDFDDRLGVALDAAVARTPAGGTALVVSHGGSIRAVARLLGARLHRVGNLSGLLLEGHHDGTAPRALRAVDLLGPDPVGLAG